MRRQLAKLLASLKQHWTLLVVSHDAGELLPMLTVTGKLNKDI